MAESLLERAEQWNSWAPDPSKILCRFLSVIPPPVLKQHKQLRKKKHVLTAYMRKAKVLTWHDDNSPFSLLNGGKGGDDR